MIDNPERALTPLDQALARVRSRSNGRTRYEGQEPYDDELMLAEIERLRPLAAERQAQLDHEARMRRPPVFTDDMDGWGGGA